MGDVVSLALKDISFSSTKNTNNLSHMNSYVPEGDFSC